MQQCPKCNSCLIHGPVFVKDSFGEVLRYFCGRCGYHRDEATKDAKPRDDMPDLRGINWNA